ncbi:flagellar hook-length control protein FliK [Microbulbifer sp. ARAS458-1]|uniref:flagellar hook-length control protein FliK n=1 Tax=Microbulbifer sp. ARAS458-1 TaxID=3140242 RepID=UPI00387826EB
MSGINTLLDTLLHQVLGKRVETAPRDRALKPVKPIDATRSVHAVRSDARLNQHAAPPYAQGVSSKSGEIRLGAVSTHYPVDKVYLSRAAQYISTILERQVVSASVSPSGAVAIGGSEASEVASLLKASVVFSGLFYESHLVAWYRGIRDKTLLQREPQMALWLSESKTDSGLGKDLQRLIGKQLDLLATRSLIWHGELWPGVFVEIRLTPPFDEQPEVPYRQPRTVEQCATWHLEVALQMESLGPVTLVLKVSGSLLELEVRAATQIAADRINAAVAVLKGKLEIVRFHKVIINVVVVK